MQNSTLFSSGFVRCGTMRTAMALPLRRRDTRPSSARISRQAMARRGACGRGRGRRDLQAEAVGIVPQLRAAGGRTAEEVPHADHILAVRGQRPQLVGAQRLVRAETVIELRRLDAAQVDQIELHRAAAAEFVDLRRKGCVDPVAADGALPTDARPRRKWPARACRPEPADAGADACRCRRPWHAPRSGRSG